MIIAMTMPMMPMMKMAKMKNIGDIDYDYHDNAIDYVFHENYELNIRMTMKSMPMLMVIGENDRNSLIHDVPFKEDNNQC